MNGGARRPDFVDALLPTLVALIVYRLGQLIPIPGLEPKATAQLLQAGNVDAARVAILALDIYPLFGILILFELAKMLAPRLRRWERAEARNAAKLARIALIVALISAVVQSNGIVTALEEAIGVVTEPGPSFRLSTTFTLVAGTLLVGWLARQISSRGLGSGLWLIVIAPTLAGLLPTVATLVEFQRQGVVSPVSALIGLAFVVAAVAAVVALLLAGTGTPERARACAWSTVLAYSTLPFLLLPVSALAHLTLSGDSTDWLEQGHPVRLVTLALLLWLYLALYARSCRLADVEGPGLPSLTMAAMLAVAALGCEALPTYLGVPVILSGQPLLVVTLVTATLSRDWGNGPLAQGVREAQSSGANR